MYFDIISSQAWGSFSLFSNIVNMRYFGLVSNMRVLNVFSFTGKRWNILNLGFLGTVVGLAIVDGRLGLRVYIYFYSLVCESDYVLWWGMCLWIEGVRCLECWFG